MVPEISTSLSEDVPSVCGDNCEYRWGRNCAAHWLEDGWDRIVNDVDELNRLAAECPWVKTEHTVSAVTGASVLVLQTRDMRYLITDFRNLEYTDWLADGIRRIEFSRHAPSYSVPPSWGI
jgi:hypothetical protein